MLQRICIIITEEDIYIYHEMISQEGASDDLDLVQRQCQAEWPTTGADNEGGKVQHWE